MRIGIDARFLTHPQAGGFKTYTESLVAALAEVDPVNEYILYLDRPLDQKVHLPNQSNFANRIVAGSRPMLGMLWREQVSLSRQAARDRLDLLHSPCLTAPLRLSCPSVVTIHDMIWYAPEKFSNGRPASGKRKLMEWYYRRMPELAARRAAAVVTVSHAAKSSIAQELGLPTERIFVTHEAAAQIYRQIDHQDKLSAIRQKYNLTSDFILALGSADPRKNISTLVEAYSLLPPALRNQRQLAIVWTHNFLAVDLAAKVEALGLMDQLCFLERVSNEDLVLLYNAAALFVFPSRYEGFGLPLLEAMACGTPLVAADNSSIPEVVGEAGLLVNAEDAQAIATAMAQVLTDETLRSTLIERGLKRVAGFSWAKCAHETMAVYRRVLR